MTDFGTRLLDWYNNNYRNLPWRQTTDPYKIWISEIILQQTRVAQGLDYYHRFIDNFPNVQSLAQANEEQVLRLWQGLGYYSRARNLHQAAKTIVEKHNSQFPNTYKEILNLKGIGTYTAAAIASFAFQLPYAVLDGNVYRFISRIKGIDTPIDSTEGKKRFTELANELLNTNEPAHHNQAMMEMGAVICKAQSPECDQCPFQTDCVAFLTGQIPNLPVKSKKISQRHRYFNYFLVDETDTLYIQQRNGKDIWQNLYQLPLIESEKKLSANFFKKQINEKVKLLNETKHILSHQIIHSSFFLTTTNAIEKLGINDYQTVKKAECINYPFPQLVVNFFNEQNIPGYKKE
ncbi:A/G-specific adenine glycosylase [Carboxylicivirga caseinilyticus]|uniref:A/G-specific adenine glycosylase n=1 Tax=Carboxylicivirga caseinilyticus TaxID=3417572 RepID=UPI003D34FCD5|nr:A/G-specific adenine glycosylase [Marinilabiliaceae bacterium A049]